MSYERGVIQGSPSCCRSPITPLVVEVGVCLHWGPPDAWNGAPPVPSSSQHLQADSTDENAI